MALKTLSPYPGKDFDLATYLRQVTSKKFGIADPRTSYWGQIGQVASGQVSSSALDQYRKMQLENPLMKPGDIRSHFNRLEQESRQRKIENVKRMSAMRQAQQVSGMNPEEISDYYTRLEERRLAIPGQVLSESGKSLDDILAAQRGEGIYARQQAMFSQRMAPKQLESYREGIQDAYDIANQALWNMADTIERVYYKGTATALPDGTPIYNGYAEINGVFREVKESDFGGGDAGHALWVTYKNTEPAKNDVSKYGEFRGLMYQWLHGWAEELQDNPAATQYILANPLEFSVFNAITPLPFDTQIPVRVSENAGLHDPRRTQTQNLFLANGSMYDGMILDSVSGLNFALMIPEDETWQVRVVQENGKDVIKFVNATEPVQTVDIQPVTPTVTPTPEPTVEPVATEPQYIDGELYRIRDFSVPQYLTPEQADVYFPGIKDQAEQGDTIIVQAAADGNLAPVAVISANGYRTNYSAMEDGTFAPTELITPDGVSYTPEEWDAYTQEQTAIEAELVSNDTAVFGSESLSSVHSFLLSNSGKNNGLIFPTGTEMVPVSLASAGLQPGQVLVQVTEPTFKSNIVSIDNPLGTITGSVSAPTITPWLKEQEVEIPKDTAGFWTSTQPSMSNWPVGTEVVAKDGGWSVYPASAIQYAVDEYGRPVMNVYDPGPTTGEATQGSIIAQYHLPAYDDANLPQYIHKVGNEYLIDISTTEGFQHLIMYYPERFFNIIANSPRNDKINDWLKASTEEGGLGWTAGEVRDFYETYGPPPGETFWSLMRSAFELPGQVINYGAEAVGDVAAFIFDPYDHDPTSKQEIDDFFTMFTEGAVVSGGGGVLWRPLADIGKFVVPYMGISGLAYTAEAGYYSIGDEEFRQRLVDGWSNYGLTYFFNGNVRSDLEQYSDAPDWLLGATDVASMLVSGKVAMSKPTMPIAFRTVRTGPMSFVKSLRTTADVRMAAAYNGYTFSIMKKGKYAGSMRLNVDHKFVYLRNIQEANHYFKTGNTLGDTTFARVPASDKSHKVTMDDGSTIKVSDPKPPVEVLTHLAQNHPGRLGAGFLSFVKAKGFQITNGKLGSPFKSGKLASTEEVLNITREAIEAGKVSIDQMIRSANQIRLWQDGAADALAGHIMSQLNARFGFIDRMLKIRDGEVVEGIKRDLPGAPEVNGKVSRAWNDVFEHHKMYEFNNPNVHRWIEGAYKIIDDLEIMATKYGIKFDRKLYTDMLGMAHYFPRGRVIEKIGAKLGIRKGGAPAFPSSKLKEQNPRAFELQQEGLELGYRYDTPANTLASYISHVYRAIANAESKKLFDSINLERAALDETELGLYLKQAKKAATEQAKYGQSALNVIKNIRYHHIIPNVVDIATIRRFSPELADKVSAAASMIRKYGGKEYDIPWSTKVTEKIDELYYEADQMLQEAVGIAKEQTQQRAAAVEAMRHVGFTEATGNRVGLYGSIFEDITVNGRKITGKEIETMLEKAWHTRPNLILRSLSDLNRNLVMLQTIDMGSAAFIQGIYTLGFDVRNLIRRKPSFTFAQAYADMLAAEFVPKVRDVFRLRNADYMNRAIKDGLIISESGTEFIQRGTIIEKAVVKIPVAGQAYSIILDAANRGFSFWGESARVRMGKYMEREWLRQGGTGAELQEMLNNMTGVTSSKTIGVGVLQRTYESIGLFAPRFLRANLMMMNRMIPVGTRFGGPKRGMTGRMLSETLLGTMAGWVGIYVALCGALPGNWPPKLKPWPKSMGGDGSEAFTLNIGGQNIGILGGFPFSFMKMWGSLLANAIDNPKKIFTVDFSSLSALDQSLVANNPLYQFATGRVSPIGSLVREMITGKDYLGYNLAKEDYLEEVANMFLPFVLQSVITQDEPANPAAFVAGLFGLRNFPDSQWDKFYDASATVLNQIPDDFLFPDQVEKRNNGSLQWQDLSKWQKETFLAQNPELQDAYNNAVENENKRRDANEIQWAADRDQYIADREAADNADFAILRAGGNTEITSTRDIRTHLSDNTTEYSTLMEDLRRRYPELYELFETEKGTSTQFDKFYNEYYDIIFNESYTLPGGTPDYEAIDSAIEALRTQYPEEFWTMLDDLQRYGFAGQDPLKLKLWEDKKVIRSYFDLPEGQQRIDYRKDPANSEVEAALVFWGYVTTIENDNTEAIVKQWCEDYSVPEKMIPALLALVIPEDMMQKYHITDPTLQRQYNDLPEEGWSRKRFLVEHPEYLRYYIDELGHKEFDDDGDPIYDPAKVPSISEEAYITSYQNTDSTMRKAWRCRNQEGEQALIKFGYLSKVLYGSEECQLLMQGGGDAAEFFSQQAQ